jgi:hypothetical protein
LHRSILFAYPESFTGGVNVAAADLDGDGTDELITAPASGTGPLVRIFKPSGELITEASVFDRQFRGGVSLAAGKLDGSGADSIVAAPASNGASLVSVLVLENGKLVLKKSKELATDSGPVGVSLSLASVNGQENQIVASLTPSAKAPEVFLLSQTLNILKQFSPTVAAGTAGLQVAAGDISRFDRLAELVISTLGTARQKMQIFSLGTGFSQTAATKVFAPYGWSTFAVNMIIGSWR